MKTFAKMLMCMVIAALLSSCEKDPELVNRSINTDALKSFDASFIVYDHTEGHAPIMEGGCQKIWKGLGESARLGMFSVEINLICDLDNLLYRDLTGSFKAEDGSTLHFQIAEGKYLCNEGTDSRMFPYSFNDLAVISGGTGRFAGATGHFYPNAKIHNEELPNWFAKFSCLGDLKLKSESQQEEEMVAR